MEKIKISAVSYLNTRPFIYGIEHSGYLSNYILELDNPAQCARRMVSGNVQIGLVPVAAIADIPNAHIITDYCIGCDGAVDTVKLFSEVPLDKVERIVLDYQSRTSVQLVQILAREHWDIQVEWVKGESGFESSIGGTTAGLVIGDRAFKLSEKYEHQYDLGLEWKKFTGLPFVFACWVSNCELPMDFRHSLVMSLEYGLQNMDTVIQEIYDESPLPYDIDQYLRNKIQYNMDGPKKQALARFQELSRNSVIEAR